MFVSSFSFRFSSRVSFFFEIVFLDFSTGVSLLFFFVGLGSLGMTAFSLMWDHKVGVFSLLVGQQTQNLQFNTLKADT